MSLAKFAEWLQKMEEVNLPFDIHEPQWMSDLRKLHWQAWCENGLPTHQHERFKYTDFSFLMNQSYTRIERTCSDPLKEIVEQHRLRKKEHILLVLVNGYFEPSLSDVTKLLMQKGKLIASSLNEAIIDYPALFKQHWPKQIDTATFPFVSLNRSRWTDGLFLYLMDHCELKETIHILSIATQKECVAHPHHILVLGEKSQLTFFEEHLSLVNQFYLMNQVSTITLGKGAQLDHYKLQQEGEQAIHLAHVFVEQSEDSHARFSTFSFGSTFARDDLIVQLQESGSAIHTSGFYRLNKKNQYIDHHVEINHLAPYSQSEMFYKGMIEQPARAVFNGRLHVAKGAEKIIAHQANHNLLIHPEAEVYTKPELEIYADDVKCTHGATIGQLDEEMLFYLQSRGISREEAQLMTSCAFADEIVQRIQHEDVKLKVQEWL